MPIPVSISELSTAAGSNSPANTESPGAGDDHLRAGYSFIAQLRDKLNGVADTGTVKDPVLSGTATGSLAGVTLIGPAITSPAISNATLTGATQAADLGIGATAAQELTVYEATTPTIQLCNSTTGATSADGLQLGITGVLAFIGNKENGSLTLQTNNIDRMQITAAGVIQDAAALELGYRDIPRVTGGIERGKVNAVSVGFTVNTGSAAGSTYSVFNDSAAAFTITQGAGLTLRQAGTANTGNRTLAARGIATVWFNSTTEAVISGAGVS